MFKFNPLTGKLDLVNSPGGTPTELQFNNSGAFGGTTGITYEVIPNPPGAGANALMFANDTRLYFGSDNDDYYLQKRTGQTRLELNHYNDNGLVYFNETALQIQKSLLQQGEYGVFLSLTASVNDSTGRQGMVLEIGGGTGSGFINGLAFDVTASTTNTTYINDTSLYGYRTNGIRGIFGGARANISGTQVGGLFLAGGSNSEAYGVWGAATRTRTSGVNVGVFGAAVNAAGLEFAGAFVLGSRASKPITRSDSAALLADNSTLDEDIIVGQHNAVDYFIVDNLGLTNVKAGDSTSFARVGGTLHINTTNVGNVGTGEDNLMTYSVPANTLATNLDYLDFEASGTAQSTETVKVYFGSTAILTHTFSGASAKDFVIRGKIIRTGATTQKATVSLIDGGGANIDTEITLPAETLSGAVTLKLTGEGTSNDDIVQKSFVIKWEPHNT